jgi:GntR family transcriptional regulator/GntR family frlABCD operon transcriptional regulator
MQLLNNGIPQHRQLYEILKGHIHKGIYDPGDLLPSENALCQTYSVTRPTVRQALSTLLTEGYIKKQQGKGSIVQAKKSGIGILSIKGTTDSLPTGTLETRVVKIPQVGPWKLDFDFEITDEELESGCIRLTRLRLIDGKPILYEITNLPNINLPRFCSRNFENKSMFGVLNQHYGLKIIGGEQKIWALPAEEEVCDLLKIAQGKPILHLQKRYETNRPNYYFYTSIWSNTEEHYLQGPF